MKRLSFVAEIFIWLTFSVVAGFGYAFSFFEYVEARTSMSVADIVIPTLIWILLAALSTFLLRTAQKTQCLVRFTKGEVLFLECSILLLLLIGGWVFRFVDYFHGVWPKELETTYFQQALVTTDWELYKSFHPATGIYIAFLHTVFLFLGNIYEAGVVVQFLLLLCAAAVWYLTIRKAFGVVTALFFAAGAMLLPDAIKASMQCSPVMQLFFFYGCICMCLVCYAVGRNEGFFKYLCELLLAVLVTAGALLDISGTLLYAAYLAAVCYRNRRKKLQSCWGLVLLGLGIACGLYMYQNIQPVFPGVDELKAFVFSLGRHPVFIVAIVVISIYWFLNKKRAFSGIMLAVLYLFALQLLKLDTYLKHDFIIYMGISTLLGISIQQYLLSAPKRAAKDSEPEVTVIRFEEEPAVTIPERAAVPSDRHVESSAEKPEIFIPKSMEIPKRISKPKVDFALEVDGDRMHYDYHVSENEDFDI